jgi:hypothetical protein
MKAKGEIREQYHHAIDLVPTILDCLGVEPPETIGGHVQSEFDGVSMRHSFDHAAVPSERPTQFYSMLGSPAIWHNGWKAVTTHASVSGWGSFGKDTWELYHTDVDRSELHSLADQEPERLQEMINLWYAEEGANGAFPLDDRSPLEIFLTPRPLLSPMRNRYVYYPAVAEVPESQAVNIRNRSYGIGALVDIPAPGQGVVPISLTLRAPDRSGGPRSMWARIHIEAMERSCGWGKPLFRAGDLIEVVGRVSSSPNSLGGPHEVCGRLTGVLKCRRRTAWPEVLDRTSTIAALRSTSNTPQEKQRRSGAHGIESACSL